MKNFVQEGKVINFAAPATVASGAGAMVGKIFGVAVNDYASGAANAEFAVEGVFDLAKVSAQAWATVGLPIYWDNTAKLCTTTPADLLIGVNIETAANPSSTGRVRLNGSFGDIDFT